MQSAILEYLANSLWQVPMFFGAGWLLVRLTRPRVRTEHALWLAVLGFAILLPLRGISSHNLAPASDTQTRTSMSSFAESRVHATGVVERIASESRGPAISSSSSVSDAPMLAGKGLTDAADSPVSMVRISSAGLRSLASRMLVHRIRLSLRATRWMLGVYLTTICFHLLHLLRSWSAAQNLVRGALPLTMSPRRAALFEDCCCIFGLENPPQLLVSGEVESPVVIGLWRPILLLPANFGEYTGGEARAVLCHELAHVKRSDLLVNLLCQLGSLPVAYHPATAAVQRRIRQTREMICDELAAGSMASRAGYATCLVGLARRIVAGRGLAEQVQAMGLFDSNKLEERVMRLTESKTAISWKMRAMRMGSGIAAMGAVVLTAAMFHVTPTIAASQAAVAPVRPTNPVTPVAPVAPEPAIAPLGSADTGPEPEAAVPPVPVALPSVELPPIAPIAPVHLTEPAPEPEPVPELNPAAEPEPAPAPGPAPQAPSADPTLTKSVDIDGLQMYSADRAPTAKGERQRMTRHAVKGAQIQDDAAPRICVRYAKKTLNDPEFKRRMEEVQRSIEAATNSQEFRKQMAEMAKLDEELSKLNVDKQMAELSKHLDSPEFKMQMEEARRNLDRALRRSSAQIQEDVANATKALNDPAMRKQIEEAARSSADAVHDREAIDRAIEEAQKQLRSGDLQRQIDAATKAVREAAKSLKSLDAK